MSTSDVEQETSHQLTCAACRVIDRADGVEDGHLGNPIGLAGVDHEFDEFPFGLLTMIVSLEAIFLATFVMISQNRQASRADLRSQLDFENNIRSEIWSVHVGEAIGLDVEHVEDIVHRAIDGAQAAMRNAPTAPAKPTTKPAAEANR